MSTRKNTKSSPTSGCIAIGGNAVGSVLTTGSGHRVNADTQVSQVTLPPPASVEIRRELDQIRSLLKSIPGSRGNDIEDALVEAVEESAKPTPDRSIVGGAVKRALEYANDGGDLAEHVVALAPHVKHVVAWLGSHWHQLLGLVGLAL